MRQNKPAHEIKLGKIRVAIWANETENREVWFNAVVTRLYKTNDKWKETTSLGHTDLPMAMKAIDMAHSWICRKHVQLQRAGQDATKRVLAKARRPS